MKKILLILVTVLMLPLMASAQDARNRTVATVIADAMAQLPAQQQDLYNSLMDDLGNTGAEGVVKMAAMLVPADKGQNNIVEYALNGLVAYVNAPGREAMARTVNEGLVTAVEKCDDEVNKAFLISLLGRFDNADNIAVLEQYLSDPYLADPALNAISQLPGANDAIARYVNSSTAPDVALVRIAGQLKTPGVEDRVLAWTALVPEGQKHDYYRTLARIGGVKSLAVLEKAARKAGYKYDADDAVTAYVAMLNDGMGRGFDPAILSSARKTMGVKAPTYVRGGALASLFALQGKKALPELVKAVKSDDRQYRVNALRLSTPWADDETFKAVNQAASKNKDINAVTDVINWYAANGNQGQIDYVVAGMENADPTVSTAAIKAAGVIGGPKALEALSAQLYGPKGAEAAEALCYFNGDITDCVKAAIESNNADAKTLAVKVADRRHVKAALPGLLAIINGDATEAMKSGAYKALASVAAVNDLDVLVNLAGKAQGADFAAVSNAIKTVLTGLPQDEQNALLQPYLNGNSAAALYPALAQCGTKEAVQVLKDAYSKGDMNAFNALLVVDNNDMIPVLYDIATKDASVATPALKRYAELAAQSGYSGSRLFDIYTQGLAATDDTDVQEMMLDGLGETRVFGALDVAKKYIDNPATGGAAAGAIKYIASKNNYSGADVVSALEAAKAYYVGLGTADAGYAVDEINSMIQRMSYDPVFKLSPEEEAQGFEILFDGTSLDRWKGNKTNYVPVDGAILVTAQYGGEGTGNLYTDKEYSDFIYRFEFCFDAPGVNNGIGIRTTEGVDAAYHGMEIQVLEHDAPIYADLKPHQVHGSVYGIIPAKRIKSPETGKWNTEEIRAVGDHITVTVNGEVIVDGNIRKACKGHNVAPDGSNVNPYTVDHFNHPGLFNKRGLISFCGHGPGVRFRNIRIKDLSK